MYRVNSIAKSLVTFQVYQDGKLHSVNLLPRNFVFTERVTPQIENLVKQRVLRVHEVKDPVVSTTSSSTNADATTTATSAGVATTSAATEADNGITEIEGATTTAQKKTSSVKPIDTVASSKSSSSPK